LVSFELPHKKLTMGKSNFFTGQPIFSQLIDFIPRQMVKKASISFQTDRYCKKFDTYHHLITMLYACYQHCTSLREVVTGLQACEGRLQSLNINYLPARSTLSEANQRRTYEVFAKLYYELLERYHKLLADSRVKNKLLNRLIIIDSTTISLFQEILKNAGRPGVDGKKKGGIKVHMAVNAREDVPYLIRLTAAAKADVPLMRELNPPKGSIVVMDKGYNNYHWMNQWKLNGVDWVTRLRYKGVYKIIEELSVSEKQAAEGVISDQLILMGVDNNQIEQVPCRLVCYYDNTNQKAFQFITSNRRWSPTTVAMLYKQRWQIEMLFKRLKQNMPLEYFLGDNENAIKIQIFCSLIADLLLKVVMSRIKRRWAFSNLASLIRLHLLNYTHIYKFLENPERSRIYNPAPDIQLTLNLSG
jgi:hypothetical protein